LRAWVVEMMILRVKQRMDLYGLEAYTGLFNQLTGNIQVALKALHRRENTIGHIEIIKDASYGLGLEELGNEVAKLEEVARKVNGRVPLQAIQRMEESIKKELAVLRYYLSSVKK